MYLHVNVSFFSLNTLYVIIGSNQIDGNTYGSRRETDVLYWQAW